VVQRKKKRGPFCGREKKRFPSRKDNGAAPKTLRPKKEMTVCAEVAWKGEKTPLLPLRSLAWAPMLSRVRQEKKAPCKRGDRGEENFFGGTYPRA